MVKPYSKREATMPYIENAVIEFIECGKSIWLHGYDFHMLIDELDGSVTANYCDKRGNTFTANTNDYNKGWRVWPEEPNMKTVFSLGRKYEFGRK